MESNNKQRVLYIATDSHEMVIDVVNRFNKAYKSKFVYLDSTDREGVLFSVVNINGESDDRIFLLGSAFGSTLRGIREREKNSL